LDAGWGDIQELVYLSPDAPTALTELDATKTYVIGGIVDKSRKKVTHPTCWTR
jgi:Trm5-related predicted tRNA methylase